MQSKMPRGKTVEVKCATCGNPFTARVADRKRGWAKCCSKSCAATRSNAKTGKYQRYLHSHNSDGAPYYETEYYEDDY